MLLIRHTNEVPPRAAPNRTIRELVSGASGAHGVTLRVVELLPASAQTPRRPHAHPDFEELIYVLAGYGQIWADGALQAVGPGDAVLVPAGTLHATFNTSEEPLRLACFFPTPGGVDEVILGEREVEGV